MTGGAQANRDAGLTPVLRDRLINEPELMKNGGLDELLRLSTINGLIFPHYAREDIELADVTMRAGDLVLVCYGLANFDKNVFPCAEEFDITRSPNPHLSFGIAQHFCLGVHLARLEGRVFFDELLSTFPVIEQTGHAQRIRSNLNNGLKSLPVELGR